MRLSANVSLPCVQHTLVPANVFPILIGIFILPRGHAVEVNERRRRVLSSLSRCSSQERALPGCRAAQGEGGSIFQACGPPRRTSRTSARSASLSTGPRRSPRLPSRRRTRAQLSTMTKWLRHRASRKMRSRSKRTVSSATRSRN